MSKPEKDDSAAAKLPAWRFLLIEFRKLLVPILTAAISGGGTAFVGWQVQGRSQAKDDASQAARDQVRLLEDLKAFIEARTEPPSAALPSFHAADPETQPVPLVAAPIDDDKLARLLKEFADDKGVDPSQLPPPAWIKNRQMVEQRPR